MADTNNFFTSGNFSSSLSTVGGIANSFISQGTAKIQAQYATDLQRLKNDATLTESVRQQKIAELNSEYQIIIQSGKNEAREDYFKYVLVGAGTLLIGLGLWLGLGKRK